MNKFTDEQIKECLESVVGSFQRAADKGMIQEVVEEAKSHFIDSETVISKDYALREDRLKAGEEPCFICGRGIKEGKAKHYIHYLTDGRITDIMDSSEFGTLSQGAFPVGGECKNKLPKRFIITLENIK